MSTVSNGIQETLLDERHERYNDFEHVQRREATGVLGNYLRAKCSTCAAMQSIRVPKGHRTVDQPNAEDLFRRKGWLLGKNRKFDTCPSCVSVSRTKRREQHQAFAEAKTLGAAFPPELKLVAEQGVTLQEAKQIIAEEAAPLPTIMTKEDKRLIFLKLNDHYGDEQTGYEDGWSDKKIADDLGVPVAWVAGIRDADFGPERSNEEVRQAVQQARVLLTTVTGELERLNQIAVDTIKWRDKMEKEYKAIEKKITEFERLYK